MAGSIYGQLLTYSEGLQPWQRDALRRLALSPTLSTSDISEITDIAHASALQNENGLIDDETPYNEAPDPEPLTALHLPSNDADAPPVTLKEVHHLQGVNRMRVPTNITLNPKGLNVVFGYNGVGKSGYTRILKSSCRSKHHEPVLGNVYDSQQVNPLARVDYLLGEEEASHEWNPNEPSTDENLARVAVYDTKSANAHVSAKGTELTVTPQGLDLLTSLCLVYDGVASEARNRISALNALPSPGIAAEAKDPQVRQEMQSLGTFGSPVDIAIFAVLDEKEKEELQSLPATISHRRTNSQSVRLGQAQAKLNQHHNQARRLEVLASKVSSTQMTSLRDIRVRLNEIAENEAAQSAHDFSSEPVQGVMTTHWKTMWAAVKEFADEEAYSTSSFPSADGAHCPLCHQTLDVEAQERLMRFSEAMANDLADEKKRRMAQEAAIVGGIEQALGNNNIDELLLTTLHAQDPGIVEQLRADIEAIREALTTIPNSAGGDFLAPFIDGSTVETGNGDPIPGFTVSDSILQTVTFLDKAVASIQSEVDAIQHESSDGSEVAGMEARLLHLQERQTVTENYSGLHSLHNRLIHILALDTVVSQSNTKPLSDQSAQLCQEYVAKVATDFQENLRMLEDLQADASDEDARLKVSLTGSEVRKGVSKIAFTIKGAKSKTHAENVLSEGELRAVSLSAFLADVSSSGDGSAILFDDPMNSLDQEWQIRVAKRLVKEARHRQVIVFTHSTPFAGVLQDFGIGKEWDAQVLDGVENPEKVEFTRLDITQHPETGTGIQRSSNAGKNGSASMMAALERDYKTAKAHFDDLDWDAYDRDCRDFGNQLRQVWEAAVEDVVVAGIVGRGKFKVQTTQLKGLLAFDKEDIATINGGMEVNDFFVHSTGEGWEQSLPQPKVLRRRLDDFYQWSNDFKSRKDAAIKEGK